MLPVLALTDIQRNRCQHKNVITGTGQVMPISNKNERGCAERKRLVLRQNLPIGRFGVLIAP